MLGLLALIWGSSFILMKRGLTVFSFYQVAALRLGITFLVMLPFIVRYFPASSRRQLGYASIVGLCGSGIPAFLFTFAQTHISSATAGILNALTPLFTFIVGIIAFGVSFRWQKLIGVLMGLAGAIWLITHIAPLSPASNIAADNRYGILIVIATFCYGISVNTVQKYCQDMNPIQLNSLAFSLLGVPAWVFILSTDFIDKLQHVPHAWTALGYIATLAILGSAFTNVVFFKLAQQTSALFAASVTFLIPVVALLWGIVDGEPINAAYFVGLFLILGGIYVSNR